MNLPNKLTMARIIIVIPFVIALMLEWNIVALILFVAASVTDYLDGYIARRDNLITDFGKLMDPLADKILVMAALICFVELQYIQAWMVIVILFREFFITGLRTLASAKGAVIPADNLGKYKTVAQIVAIILIFFTKTSALSWYIMSVPMFLTIWSGIDYFVKGREFLTGEM